MERPESARHGLEDTEYQGCLVTGASQGIGLATAWEFAKRKARLILTSRERERAESIAARIGAETGSSVLGLELDVTDLNSMETCLHRASKWLDPDPITILINNAGLPIVDELWSTPFHEMPPVQLARWFERVYEVDVVGSRNLTRAVLPGMMDARQGSIVFVSSTPALAGHHATPYTEAKAALLGLMRDTAVNYAGYNVRANAVAPGNIRTSWFDRCTPEQREELRQESPLMRWGDPEEVARVIAFFGSPQSSFVTGQTLVIDGGKVIH